RSRRADVVGFVAHGESRLTGDEDGVAASGDGFAENLFGSAFGIDICGVKKIDSSFEADVDETGCLFDVSSTPGLKEFAAAPEGAGAEAENGNFESRVAELSKFHRE